MYPIGSGNFGLFLLVVAVTTTFRVPVLVAADVVCPHPSVPARATVQLTSDDRRPGTLATFSCDKGYELLGESSKVCSADGTWTKGNPACGTNVALHKPSSQVSKADAIDGDAKFGADGDEKTCTRTKAASHPWWSVDLLRAYQVRAVRLVPNDEFLLENLEIRVGNSSRIDSSVLCTWFPGVQEKGAVLMEKCSRPVTGQFLFVQSRTTDVVLSLCEVLVFSSDELAAAACVRDPGSDALLDVIVLNSTCYEFQVDKDGDLETARSQCRSSLVNGDLLQDFAPKVFSVVKEQLEARKLRMRSNRLVWLGAQREPGPLSRIWKWIGSGEHIRQPMWARDQPNNYIGGDQNCVALDGQRNWDWNDLGCNVNYLNWICQGGAWSCGRPDVNENSTVILVPDGSSSVGAVARYICPPDSRVDGSMARTCGPDSRWTGQAPTCTYVNCGPVPVTIANGSGRLVEQRTTFNATVEYSCDMNYTMVGYPIRKCGPNGQWTGEEPACLYKWCERLSAPINGTVVLENDSMEAGSAAAFSCDRGHVLEGPPVVTCELGGRWSGPSPVCRFVDCGSPGSPIDGTRFLLNGTTTLGSVVQYSCNENFRLVGPRSRVCRVEGSWSGTEPMCELVTCPRPPVPPGGIVSGQSLNVGAVIEYACDPGNYLVGPDRRICNADGEWSDSTPECRYVNCGPLQPIVKGTLNYVNESTNLDSHVVYGCSRNFRMVGDPVRVCQRDGEWSGDPPKCEEIRCGEPEKPPHATVHVRNNDRARSQAWSRAQLLAAEETSRLGNPNLVANSYRIGARATYQCEPGYRIDGQFVRQCENTGAWTKSPPSCTYVDCGIPPSLSHGSWGWPGESKNATYLGITVIYGCDEGYRLLGRNSRTCEKDGAWAGEMPVCEEIRCEEPEKPGTVFKVTIDGYGVGSRAIYSCAEGQEMAGDPNVYCLNTGFWSGSPPTCSWVDCGEPGELENGRVYKLNQTNVYNSLVEFHCFPNYSLRGRFSRKCGADGKWEGETPRCELDTTKNEIPGSIAASPNLNSEQVRSSSSLGTYVAVGAVVIFLLLIVVAVLWLRMRRASAEATKYVGDPQQHPHHGGGRAGVELKPYGAMEGVPGAMADDESDYHGNGIYANLEMDGGYAIANDGYSDPDPRPGSSSSSMTSFRTAGLRNNTVGAGGGTGRMARLRREGSPGLVPGVQPSTVGAGVTINGITLQ